MPKITKLENFFNPIDCRVVRTKEELEKAYALVYKEYLKKGYTKDNPSKLRLSIFNAFPKTATFAAIMENKDIVATATIIPDSPIGLPMDMIYNSELNKLREDKIKLCEISMLVSDSDFCNKMFARLSLSRIYFILLFFKVFLDYVTEVLELDYICIAINPKNKIVYDLLLFKDLGEVKDYPDVNNAPAIAKYLDVCTVKEGFSKPQKERLYKIFVVNKTAPEKFAGKIELMPDDLRYFFVEKSDIFKTATPFQLEYIESCYPNYNWAEIMK